MAEALAEDKKDALTAGDWVRSLGPGLLTGTLFVAVAMLVENRIIQAGKRLIR